jgi:hypothetical protein
MGVVYRAQDPTTGTEVAIKTVRSRQESDLSGLRRETSALWRLRHPGVVRILDEGLLRGRPWFAMELLHGTSLRRLNVQLWAEPSGGAHRLDLSGSSLPARTKIHHSTDHATEQSTVSGGAITGASPAPRPLRPTTRPPAAGGRLREVLLLMRRLCATLGYVHSQGYVHRDLKPSNVFLRPDGSPVLVDFGLVCRFPALRAREALEPAGVRVGTVHYMAPEQIRAELVDARADMYAVGCLLYEAVTGQRPFEAPTAEEVAEQQLAMAPTAPGALVSDVPGPLEDLIMRLLVKDARERTSHAEEIAEELARLAPHPGVPAEADIGPPRVPYFFRPSVAGRRNILAELERALYTASHGQGAIFLLAGERGLGKTLLLSQTVRKGAVRDFRVVTGRCLPGEENGRSGPAALSPITNILRVVADRCRKGGPQVVSRLLGAGAVPLAALEPSLRAFVPRGRTAEPGSPQEEEGPVAEPDLASLLADTVAALARDQRLLLAFDDLQWADPLTLAVLEALRPERVAELPLMIVGAVSSDTLRPELQALAVRAGARTVSLGPLTEEALSALVGDLLAMRHPPAGLVKMMERRSRGNPARVIEALRGAAADGLLVRRHDRWMVTKQLPGGFWLRQTVRGEQTALGPAPNFADRSWAS